MATVKKLQNEIVRVMRKIDEGCALFDDIWDKVHSAESSNLREKYEGELKKEIKKLQRLREQVKNWYAGNEVRDKTELLEARRLIETKMEAFKECERETKTKTYSKAGLERGETLDPEEEAKQKTMDWVQERLDELNTGPGGIEDLDAEIDKLGANRKKKNSADADIVAQRLEQQHTHVRNMELILRLLDNGQLQPEKLDEVKEDIEFYIETCKEVPTNQDIGDMTDFYEQLDLNEFNTAAARPVEVPAVAETGRNARKKERKAKERPSKKATKARSIAPSIPTIGRAVSKPTKAAKKTDLPVIGRAQPRKKDSTATGEAKGRAKARDEDSGRDTDAKPAQGEKRIDEGHAVEPVGDAWAQSKTQETIAVVANSAKKGDPTYGGKDEVTGKGGKISEPTMKAALVKPLSTSTATAAQQKVNPPARMENAWAAPGSSVSALKLSPTSPELTSKPDEPTTPKDVSDPKRTSPAPSGDAEAADQRPPAQDTADQRAPVQDTASALRTSLGSAWSLESRKRSAFSTPEPSSRSRIKPKNADQVRNLAELLEASYKWVAQKEAEMIMRHDGQERAFSPQNVMLGEDELPQGFPVEPAPNLLRSLEAGFYRRLSTDTLFFIFYQHQGSFQQYAAAQELHGQGWLFHQRHKVWLKRVPGQSYPESRSGGAYVFFDYRSWVQRRGDQPIRAEDLLR